MRGERVNRSLFQEKCMKEIKEKPKMAGPKELRKEQKLPRIISGAGQRAIEHVGFPEESQSDPEYPEQKTEEIAKETAGRALEGTHDSVQRIRDYSRQTWEGKQAERMETDLSEANEDMSEPKYRHSPKQIQNRPQHDREFALDSGTEEKAVTGPDSAGYGKKEHGKNHTDSRSRVSVKQKESGKKISGQPVKAMEPILKTAKKTVKTSQTTVKTAEKNAKASVRSAQRAREAAIQSARASAKAAKMIAKGIAEAVKAIIAEIKQLIAAIVAGGWTSAVILIITAIAGVSLSLCFGIFGSNDTANGTPMTQAIRSINEEFKDSIDSRIKKFQKQYEPDETVLVYEGDADSDGGVMNWADVLGIYAVRMTTGEENPTDVLVITEEKIDQLREIFFQMNAVSFEAEPETEETPFLDDTGTPVTDEEGNIMSETKTTLTITVSVSSMDYRQGANYYVFDPDQKEQLYEIMRPEYYPMFAQLTGDLIGNGGEYGFGLDINPDLPPNELGYQIVQAAKRYIGRSYSSMDCSTLARTAYADCGLTSMNGLSSMRMAQKCLEMGWLFTDASQLQAGDLIFFASFDPSRGPDYCNDRKRCGDGKCRRWMHIHHVAIYINDEYLIDSTGGDNSVQIRKHWGMDTKTTKWVCYGRPTQ